MANDIEDRRPNWSAMIALFVLLACLISIPRKMMLLLLHYSEPNGVDYYFMREHGAVIVDRRSFHSPAFCRSFSLLGILWLTIRRESKYRDSILRSRYQS